MKTIRNGEDTKRLIIIETFLRIGDFIIYSLQRTLDYVRNFLFFIPSFKGKGTNRIKFRIIK